MFKQKVVSILSVLGIVFAQFAFVNTSFAAGFELSPAKWDGILTPGETIDGVFSITNRGESVDGLVSVLNFTYQDETGSPKILPPNPDLPHNQDFSKWFTFSEDINLPKDDIVEIPYTITVPEDAKPGGHYATVFVEQKNDEEDPNAIQTVTRIGSLFILRVEAEGVNESINIEEVEVSFETEGENEKKLILDVYLKNSGNVHLVPGGKISLLSPEGETVGVGEREAVTDGQGITQNTKEVDYVRFNKQKFLILPGQTRKYTEEINSKDIVNGSYIADIALDYKNGRKKMSEYQLSFNSNDNDLEITNRTTTIPVSAKVEKSTKNVKWLYPTIAILMVLMGVGVYIKRKK